MVKNYCMLKRKILGLSWLTIVRDPKKHFGSELL
jgi:hypothetical protein